MSKNGSSVNLDLTNVGYRPLSHGNLVPMPIRSEEPVSLKIQLVSGETLEVSGESVRSEIIGEARCVEDLPRDLWPGHSES